MMRKALRFEVTGLVQGVGFRPFVYRIAWREGISGWVRNTNKGVTIKAQGTEDQMRKFRYALQHEFPSAARIDRIEEFPSAENKSQDFVIRKSTLVSGEITDISPDIAVCDECLSDMKTQPHRKDFPFINCTHCGPRFSIIRDVPYDRKNTTMAGFEMCEQCAGEYRTITDRRFHAQPVACNRCGPEYRLHANGSIWSFLYDILNEATHRIDAGQIGAIKGIGGYQLICDAQNPLAVETLRKRKNRSRKPFALMARDMGTIRHFCRVNEAEEYSLNSWRRPVVLLKVRQDGDLSHSIPCAANPGLDTLGFILPYMPFHYQLFERMRTKIIVFTSGNLSDNPIIFDDSEAMKELSPIADFMLLHNRPIYNLCDDSVVMIAGGKERMLRRSRGYTPGFLRIPFRADGILALGAGMNNCFCLGKNYKAIGGQYNGDLSNPASADSYVKNIGHFLRLFRHTPVTLVRDTHPGYFSTGYAEELKKQQNAGGRRVKIVEVQHHHAHIASVMAEYGLDEKVIGVCFDGTGYGTDDHIWGGEFLICDLTGFERVSHLEYIPLPGGDKAIEEPWRTALSFLFKIYGEETLELPLIINREIPQLQREFIKVMIREGINSPLSSGAGRLFDAVSALLGLCLFSNYEAEAPMKLESIIAPDVEDYYEIAEADPVVTTQIIRKIVEDVRAGVDPGIVSARFHNTIIELIFQKSMELACRTGLSKIVLSGGVFQNRYLVEGLLKKFSGTPVKIFLSSKVPSNDGGIAFGQLVIAAKRKEQHVSRSTGKSNID